MKKILAGILFLFLVIGSCFAFPHRFQTFITGYVVNCETQTIEKTTLDVGADLRKLGYFFYTKDGKAYKAHSGEKSFATRSGWPFYLWTSEECGQLSIINEDGTIYDIVNHQWYRFGNKDIESIMRYKMVWEERSMKEAIIDYIKEAEDNYEMDLSDLLEKVEAMEFEE